jgi:putative transposase
MSKSPHRKLVRHCEKPGTPYESTSSSYGRLPLLTNNHWRGVLSRAADRALKRHGFALAASVYMPEHVHVLVWPRRGEYHIDRLLRAIKRPDSSRTKPEGQASQVTCFRNRPRSSRLRCGGET